MDNREPGSSTMLLDSFYKGLRIVDTRRKENEWEKITYRKGKGQEVVR